ncbi:MAG TPA: hypothetical protein PL029_02245 [Bacteroidia bacterium]|nr:hypothetical protein [Bacteroidia bacterium]
MKCKLKFTGYVFYFVKVIIGAVILIVAALITATGIVREKLLRFATRERGLIKTVFPWRS